MVGGCILLLNSIPESIRIHLLLRYIYISISDSAGMDPNTGSLSDSTFMFGTQAQAKIEEWDMYDERKTKLSNLSSSFTFDLPTHPENMSQHLRGRKRTAYATPAVKRKEPKKNPKMNILISNKTSQPAPLISNARAT